MKKRIISLVMVVMMLISLVPMGVLALDIDLGGITGGSSDVTVTFTKQPADVTANVGGNATFTAEAKTDTVLNKGVKYVWVEASKVSSDDPSLSDIISLLSSASSSESGSYTIENVAASDNGKQFKCLAYCGALSLSSGKGLGYAISNAATLTVIGGDPVVDPSEPTTPSTPSTPSISDKDCTHPNVKCVSATAATCSEKALKEHYYCADCNTYFSDAGVTKVTKASLKSGDKDPTNHTDLKEVPAKDATCDEKGNTRYWYCSGCRDYFSDASGTTEVKKSDTEIKKLDHRYVWKSDANDSHHQECEFCGKTKDEGKCSGGTATCIAKAKCSTCGAEYGSIDANNHVNIEIQVTTPATPDKDGVGNKYCTDCKTVIEYNVTVSYKDNCAHQLTKVEAVEAGCEVTGTHGTKEYYRCEKCGTLYTDETAKTETTKAELDIEPLDHYKLDSLPNASVYADKYGYDESGHYHTCKYCEFKFESSSHTMRDGTATCVAGSSKCALCDYSVGEKDPDNHTGGTEIRGAYEPANGKDGYTGDTYCLGCGELIEKGSAYSTQCSGGCKDLELVKGTPRTCTADGTKDYYRCKKCNNRYLDEKGTVLVNSENIVDKCDGHDLHPTIDVVGTLNATALKEFALKAGISAPTVIQMIKDGTFDIDHILDMVSLKDIDHCSDSTYHWLGCQRCGKTLEDLRDELEGAGFDINEKFYELSRKTEHTGGTADCKNMAVCDECGDPYGEYGEHKYETVVTYPTCLKDGYTKHTCPVCGDSYTENETMRTGHIIDYGTCKSCGGRFANPFYDVSGNDWFYSPVMWAYYNNPMITTGTSDTYFSPTLPCTRAQVVAFLWRAAGRPEPAGTVQQFTDVPYTDATAYYYKAVLWAVEQGITNGTNQAGTLFSPDAIVTRAQFVTFLWRYLGSPAPTSMYTSFTDLDANEYYYKAVIWAAENGVTKGRDAAHFAPNDACSRSEVVTFLYNTFSRGVKLY